MAVIQLNATKLIRAKETGFENVYTYDEATTYQDYKITSQYFWATESLPEAYALRRVNGVKLSAYLSGQGTSYANGRTIGTYFYDTLETLVNNTPTGMKTAGLLGIKWWHFDYENLNFAQYFTFDQYENALPGNFILEVKNWAQSSFTLYGVGSAHPPYATVWLSDSNVYLYAYNQAPARGYLDEKKAQTFTWAVGYDAPIVGSSDPLYSGATAKFEWRQKGSSTIYQRSATTLTSITVPANIFPQTGEFEWRVYIKDGTGHGSYTDWSTLSTDDAQSTAAPLAPVETIEGDRTAVNFSWRHDISTGSAQTAAQLEIRQTGAATWTSLGNVSGSNQSATFALPTSVNAGNVEWRVRTSNADNVFGSWGEANFYLVSAPPLPALRVDENYQPTLTWQAVDQQAYQIEIPGLMETGTLFGTEKQKLLPFVIQTPGQYTVRLRIQNTLGLWSEWATASLTLGAMPQTIELLTEATDDKYDVNLAWSVPADFETFLVYRDEKLIAKVFEPRYTDELGAGENSYKIVAYKGSPRQFITSDRVTVTNCPGTPGIKPLEGGEWLPLKYTRTDTPERIYTLSKPVVHRHFTGSPWPVAEMSTEQYLVCNVECAFSSAAEVNSMRELFGKAVIYKSHDRIVVGVLATLQEAETPFFTSFGFSLQQTDYEEAVEP